jgi:hypothetical protein
MRSREIRARLWGVLVTYDVETFPRPLQEYIF